MRIIPPPQPGEYPPYTIMYIKLLPTDGLILKHLQDNFDMVKQLVYSLPEDVLYHRYAPGKWSIKETLVHVIDDERIFAYRALRFARNEKNNLIGFDQDSYALYSEADSRSLDNIFEEYEAVRRATIALFNGLPDNAFDRMGHGTGTANDATVRALAYHIAGHELHHINIIKEKYLQAGV
ncbi:DinB superfamily protein [Mucilaginibacter lappiensis]|uniref:Damage-inducible protein DinB n=1 Tax=Mucilaginibacter lappiensis TaxID=354630 RepID=A0ABR6PE75_9SPHI|nr:DinB family protein [Mucilaginibacter lappiensis]MBB6108064.1 putative damage-inducible protein DinB [Mucilaginibacter lappiensis]SIP88312.1 DinB superfamily protein [Mucilaginibacter lappiensis]